MRRSSHAMLTQADPAAALLDVGDLPACVLPQLGEVFRGLCRSSNSRPRASGNTLFGHASHTAMVEKIWEVRRCEKYGSVMVVSGCCRRAFQSLSKSEDAEWLVYWDVNVKLSCWLPASVICPSTQHSTRCLCSAYTCIVLWSFLLRIFLTRLNDTWMRYYYYYDYYCYYQ